MPLHFRSARRDEQTEHEGELEVRQGRRRRSPHRGAETTMRRCSDSPTNSSPTRLDTTMPVVEETSCRSVDDGDVRADERRRLLVDASVAAVAVVLLEVSERLGRGDRVHLVVAMVMERHVDKGVVRQSKHDVADVAWLGGGELREHALDASLVLVRRLGGCGCVAGDETLLH